MDGGTLTLLLAMVAIGIAVRFGVRAEVSELRAALDAHGERLGARLDALSDEVRELRGLFVRVEERVTAIERR